MLILCGEFCIKDFPKIPFVPAMEIKMRATENKPTGVTTSAMTR